MVARPVGEVLVAEDDDAVRESLEDILGLGGHRVSVADDGRQALEIMSRRHIDVLVLDLHMPNFDGISVLALLQSPPPVVIVYSALAEHTPEEVRAAAAIEVFRVLRKPVPPPELIAAVEEAFDEVSRFAS